MATFGRIEEYSESENWSQYIERLGCYFEANLLSQTKPVEKTFEELSKLVQDCLNPEPSEVIQCYKFHSKVHSHGQSVSEFVAELWEWSEKCKFGDQLEDMLRDRLVCGVADPVIQKRLLQKKTLQFKEGFELAQALEAAAKNTADLQGSTIHKLGQQGSQPKPWQGNNQRKSAQKGTSDECYRCGGSHQPSGCPFKSSKFYNCGLVGHIKTKCRGKAARMHNHGKKYITLNMQKHSVRVNLTTRRRNIDCLLAQTG